MTNLSLVFLPAALFAAGGHVEPATCINLPPRIEQVRMVCDQYCACWQTRYQQRHAMPSVREELACRNPQSDRASSFTYNGFYRQGPATGLGFESRYPVREFAFPF